MKNGFHGSQGEWMLSCCQVGVFTSDGHGLLEGDVSGEAEAVDEAALVGEGGEVVLADELVPVPRPGARVETAPACGLVEGRANL